MLYSSNNVWLYHGNCLELLDAIFAKYPEGRFDMIFADPPYFLSNGGITCHAGRMVSVHKGDWDQSRGWEWNHEFNTEWLRRCQRVLKPNGTLWVTGTHHVIFSVGFALQQLGYKILNDIAWEKPNPPPNLSCRYFTHSTETVLWAAKNDKSKHTFNYQAMRQINGGKQMKTVWRAHEFTADPPGRGEPDESSPSSLSPREGHERGESRRGDFVPSSIWTMTAPSGAEKTHGKHPTQKPVALVERCLLASTHPGDLVLDPFMGGGTTAIACVRLQRQFVGVESAQPYLLLAITRADAEIVALWLRHFKLRVEVQIFSTTADVSPSPGGEGRDEGGLFYLKSNRKIDLDPPGRSMDRINPMADAPDMPTERIFHETKFVFLSCAHVTSASVVHTTVDISLQEAWAKTPTGKKRETTHVVRCETEILRSKFVSE